MDMKRRFPACNEYFQQRSDSRLAKLESTSSPSREAGHGWFWCPISWAPSVLGKLCMETSHNQINQKEDCEREISVFKIKSSRLINMGRKMTGFNMYMCACMCLCVCLIGEEGRDYHQLHRVTRKTDCCDRSRIVNASSP